MKNNKYDLIVIGGGSGGLVCAAGGAGLGAKVALIEKTKLGGDCLNTGCVPSKALIRSAKVMHYLKHPQEYGIRSASFEFDFADVMDRVKRIQAAIEPHDSPERFEGMGVDVKFGNYRFISPHELTNDQETLYGKRIIVATGSGPFVPPVEGCEEAKCLTSDNLWNLRVLPKRLVVVGGGPIGSEMANCFVRFGSQVTIIDMAPGILLREDPDMRDFVAKAFQKEGIQFRFGAAVKKVSHGDIGNSPSAITFDCDGKEETLECDAILVAVGRRPHTDGLNLEGVGIKTNRRGIEINHYCQTSLPNVYACGDVAGGHQFTHFADYQARLILRNALFPGRSKMSTRVVPWCTFTDPELARVGLSEDEAKKANVSYDVHHYSLSDLDRAVCDSQGYGKVKVLTQKGKDTILGAAIVGFHAGDLITEFAFAMQNKLGLKAILNTIHPYPTMSEVGKRVAGVWLAARFKPYMKKILQSYFKYFLR